MIWKRKPSHLGSWSQSSPLGGWTAADGDRGLMKARRDTVQRLGGKCCKNQRCRVSELHGTAADCHNHPLRLHYARSTPASRPCPTARTRRDRRSRKCDRRHPGSGFGVATFTAAMALAPLIIRLGGDATSELLRRSARCTYCGSKGADLQHPSARSSDIALAFHARSEDWHRPTGSRRDEVFFQCATFHGIPWRKSVFFRIGANCSTL
jgi:hypothetical protein